MAIKACDWHGRGGIFASFSNDVERMIHGNLPIRKVARPLTIVDIYVPMGNIASPLVMVGLLNLHGSEPLRMERMVIG